MSTPVQWYLLKQKSSHLAGFYYISIFRVPTNNFRISCLFFKEVRTSLKSVSKASYLTILTGNYDTALKHSLLDR